MRLTNFPIFEKDIKQLFTHLVGAFGIQLVILLVFPVVINQVLYGGGVSFSKSFEGTQTLTRFTNYSEWFPQVQLFVGILISLIAASLWFAEEKEGNHVFFLKRLPASAFRIWGEKATAGFAIIILTIGIQCLFYLIAGQFGISIWSDYTQFFLYMNFMFMFAYLVGIPLSYALPNTISVIIIGMIATLMGLWIFSLTDKRFLEVFIEILWYTLIAGAGVAVVYKTRPVLIRQINIPLDELFSKQFRETRWLLITGLLLSILTLNCLSNQLSFLYTPLLILSLMLIASIGIMSYSGQEKHHSGCVLYYQPVPLSHLFWMKFGWGLILTLLPIVCIAFLCVPMLKPIEYNKSMELLLIIKSCYQYHPGVFYIYLFFTSLLFYSCGMLFSLAMQNPIYALFESFITGTIATAFYYYCQFYTWRTFPDILFTDYNFRGSNRNPLLLPEVPWMLILLLIGLTLSALRMVSDRSVLTGGTSYRQLYALRLFLFILAVTFIFFKTGWLDLIYLTTGIDLGIG